MERVKNFLLNGGLMGMARGYDHEKEGHPYGFEEFGEDSMKAFGVVNKILSESQKFGLLSNKGRYLEYNKEW